MRLHIHLGAHKTASTFLQNAVYLDRARLARDGLALLRPADLRPRIGQQLAFAGAPLVGGLAARRIGRSIAGMVASAHARGAETVLLTDENLLGALGRSADGGALYADAPHRLAALREVADAHETTVFLSLRGYRRFFLSAWAQTVRGGRWRPFDAAAIARKAPSARRWPDVLEDVARALPGARLQVWTYEAFATGAAPVLSALTGGREVRDIAPERRPLPAPSRKAVHLLAEAAERSRGGRIGIDDFDRIVRRHRKARRYSPFDQADRRMLDALYRDDLVRMRRARPEIWLEAPPQ